MDALRQDSMGIYGYKKNTTPNIDNWARNSTVYTNVYTEVPMTYPSFVSLMTGKDAVETKIHTNRVTTDREDRPSSYAPDIDPSHKTLAQILKERGYITSAFVSNPSLSEQISSIGKGFDSYQRVFKADSRYNSELYEEVMIDMPIRFLEQNRNNKFFLWLHFIDPHRPYDPIEPYRCKFNTKYCNSINQDDYPLIEEERKNNDSCQNDAMPQEKVDTIKMLYDGEIGYTDELIQKVLNALKQQGLDKNTVVVFYSDHGESFEHRFYFDHSEVLYNSTTKIPFIVHNPAKNRGKTDSTLTQNNDLIHIILSSIGIHSKLEKRKYVYGINLDRTTFSINDGTYKYILYLPYSCHHNSRYEELYNIKKDAGETTNIINDNKVLAANLKKELLKHFPVDEYKFQPQGNQTEAPPELIDYIRQLGY